MATATWPPCHLNILLLLSLLVTSSVTSSYELRPHSLPFSSLTSSSASTAALSEVVSLPSSSSPSSSTSPHHRTLSSPSLSHILRLTYHPHPNRDPAARLARDAARMRASIAASHAHQVAAHVAQTRVAAVKTSTDITPENFQLPSSTSSSDSKKARKRRTRKRRSEAPTTLTSSPPIRKPPPSSRAPPRKPPPPRIPAPKTSPSKKPPPPRKPPPKTSPSKKPPPPSPSLPPTPPPPPPPPPSPPSSPPPSPPPPSPPPPSPPSSPPPSPPPTKPPLSPPTPKRPPPPRSPPPKPKPPPPRPSLQPRIYPVYGRMLPDRIYSVALPVGTSGTFYNFALDTGSDLSWLRCNAPCVQCPTSPNPFFFPVGSKAINCTSPLCSEAQVGDNVGCAVQGSWQCKYDTPYNGAVSVGYLISSNFTVALSTGAVIQPNVTFGCAYQQTGLLQQLTTIDGLIGLNPSLLSFTEQISKVKPANSTFGYCLGGVAGGFFFFGNAPSELAPLSWVSLTSPDGYLHYLQLSRISVANTTIPIPMDPGIGSYNPSDGSGGTFIDSGYAFSYFAPSFYALVLKTVKQVAASNSLFEQTGNTVGNVCWFSAINKTFSSTSEAAPFFPNLTLSLSTSVTITILPQQYLFVDPPQGACLGFYPSPASLLGKNVIGGNLQRDFLVVYDKSKSRIGWKPYPCSS